MIDLEYKSGPFGDETSHYNVRTDATFVVQFIEQVLKERGYEQAEKDLALTWEDVESIVKIADSLLTGTAWDVVDWPDEQKYYEEVLKRFKEAKK